MSAIDNPALKAMATHRIALVALYLLRAYAATVAYGVNRAKSLALL